MSTFNKAPVAPTATSEDPSTTFTGWAAFPGCKGVLQKCIHFSTEGWGPISQPAIPGHEIVGTVVARGANAKHQIGDRVGVGCIVSSCRLSTSEPGCIQCQKGLDQMCDNLTITFNAPYKDGRGGISEGGFADRIRVYSDYAFKSEWGV
ncbi:hypothetical protein CPB97_004459 [Podila verticillata]|nr:hypothetical protein CPB97_004459 [Podila verticillata]